MLLTLPNVVTSIAKVNKVVDELDVLINTRKRVDGTLLTAQEFTELENIRNGLRAGNIIETATKIITKQRLPTSFVEALKKFGKSEDDILEYVTRYHNERSKQRFLTEIENFPFSARCPPMALKKCGVSAKSPARGLCGAFRRRYQNIERRLSKFSYYLYGITGYRFNFIGITSIVL